MCGIAAYIGKDNALPIVESVIKKLEYRGYDSTGIVTFNDRGFEQYSKKICGIDSVCSGDYHNTGHVGLGHNRWATHGRATLDNCHPIQIKLDDDILHIAHNGIVENAKEIKDEYLKLGFKFKTETDTEVLGFHLLMSIVRNPVVIGQNRAARECIGDYCFVYHYNKAPNRLFLFNRNSSLLIGRNPDGDCVISSDIVAIPKEYNRLHRMENEIIALKINDKLNAYDVSSSCLRPLEFKEFTNPKVTEHLDGQGMYEEILEQKELCKKVPQIAIYGHRDEENYVLFGCGSSYHAAKIAAGYIEEHSKRRAEAIYATDLLDRPLDVFPKYTNFIGITQSGETKDTLLAIDKLDRLGFTEHITVITNNPGSRASSYGNRIVEMGVGPEIAVASTKTFMATCLMFLHDRNDELLNMPMMVDDYIVNFCSQYSNIICLGRGLNHIAAMEIALKLKEVAYIHAEAISASEMKHGPIALIDHKTLSLFLVTENDQKIIANIEEVKARNGEVVLITNRSNLKNINHLSDKIIIVEDCQNPLFYPLIMVIVGQLLSFSIAYKKGFNVDKPRSLAKCVTV